MNHPHLIIATADTQLAHAYTSRLAGDQLSVAVCSHGHKLLQQALDSRPDLILLDAELPASSGHDLLDILHHTPETSHTKVMLLTALIDPAERQRSQELGAVDILIKSPATIVDVTSRVRYHLGKTRR